MGRIFAVAVGLLFVASVKAPLAAEPTPSTLRYGIEVGAVDSSALPTWVDGSVGKFVQHDGELTLRAYAEHSRRLTDTVSSHLVLEASGDRLGDPVNATEAYLHWRPIPRSNTRYRFRFGAVYPDLSLENTRPGWRSPYTLNYSAINAWVAEELRATGVEVTTISKLPALGPQHRLIFKASAFGWNDPAGSILAWRGWSIHDRQSRFGDKLPLQPLPLNRPGEMFGAQADVVEPFKEIDNRAGYSISAEWRVRGRLTAKGMHYDNRGDPEVLKDGQYAWDTRFNTLGARLALPRDTTFVAQWLRGNTAMGPLMSGAHAVDNDFESYFLLLSRRLDNHRVTLRYDRFSVDDVDTIAADNNNESGRSWTAAHRYRFSDRLHAAMEWSRVKTTRPGWAFNGFDTTETERLFQIRVTYAM